MIATIMYRNSYEGGDGWRYYPVNVELSDNCPICNGKRGEPKYHRQCEDGEFFDLNTWENPCGHIDKYSACWGEHKNIQIMKGTKNYSK